METAAKRNPWRMAPGWPERLRHGCRRSAPAALLTLLALLGGEPAARAVPFQLLESPAALLLRPGVQELKLDYSVETGLIPTDLLLLHYRNGLATWLELSGAALYARFRELDEERLAEWRAAAKLGLPWTVLAHRLAVVVSHRRAQGEPILVPYTGDLAGITHVISRYADGGRDDSLALLARLELRGWAYTLGLEATRAGERNIGDFDAEQTRLYTATFTPERYVARQTVLLAVENRYTYWPGRGDFYDAVPQVRWELVRNWVAEAGAAIPVVGEKRYRYVVGLTYQY